MKNKIIKGVTYVDLIILMISVSLLDSESYIPAVVTVICLGWLLLFSIANGEKYE